MIAFRPRRLHRWLFWIVLVLVIGSIIDASPAAASQTFEVDRYDDLLVSACTSAPNDCTLRGAIIAANATAQADIIRFSALESTSGSQVTINSSGLPNITQPLTIDGPGPERLLIDQTSGGVFLLGTVSAGITVTIRDIDFDGVNTGRLIENNGTLNLVNIHAENFVHTTQPGAIVYNNGTLTVVNSSFNSNQAQTGGAIYGTSASTTTLVNVTLFGNTVSSTGSGGAHLFSQGSVTMTNVTMSAGFNFGSIPGSAFRIDSASGSLNVRNTIMISQNDSDIECAVTNGATVTGSNNFSVDSCTGFTQTTQAALNLSDAANWSQNQHITTRLQLGSVAIEAGDSSFLPLDTFDVDNDGNTTEIIPTDNRGIAPTQPPVVYRRIEGSTVDVGAVEFGGSDLGTMVDTLSDGPQRACTTAPNDCTLRGAIQNANYFDDYTSVYFDNTIVNNPSPVLTLTSPLPDITTPMRIHFNTNLQNELVIQGDGTAPVFNISAPSSAIDVAFERLIITGGNSSMGGGIRNAETLTLRRVQVRGNVSDLGAGVYNTGTLNVFVSEIDNNNAITNGIAAGVAVWNGTGATTNIVNSAIYQNGLANVGTSVLHNDGTLALLNSTVSGNSATNAIIRSNTALFEIRNATITQNTLTTTGGHISANSGSGVIANTINGAQVGGVNCSLTGVMLTGGSNLTTDSSCGSLFTSVTAGELALDPLTSTIYEVPPYHLIAPESAAVNAGNNAQIPRDLADLDGSTFTTTQPIPFDQRWTGFARIRAGSVDIGAIELQNYEFGLNVDRTDDANITACTAAPNDCTLRGAINNANASSDFSAITFDFDVFPGGGGQQYAFVLNSALPAITADVAILGNGGEVIERNTAGVNFPLFVVNSGVDVEFETLVLRNGYSTTNGGAIQNNGGNVTLRNLRLTNNYAVTNGGAIFNNNGTVTLQDVTFIENGFAGATRTNAGGALYSTGASATVTARFVSFDSNRAVNGGGVYVNGGAFNAGGSNFRLNTATQQGGGLYAASNFLLVNVTLTGNSAATGGGVYATAASTPTLYFVTVTNNQATTVSGLSLLGGAQFLYNSIVGANQGTAANCNIGTGIQNGADNLATDASCGATFTAVTAVGLDLLPEQLFGNQWYHALGENSIAINRASLIPLDTLDLNRDGDTTDLLAVDQRAAYDYVRSFGPQPDVGAIESQFAVGLPTKTLTSTPTATATVTRTSTTTPTITRTATATIPPTPTRTVTRIPGVDNNPDRIGLYNPANAVWMLRNTLTTGEPDNVFVYGGIAGGIELTGDWNGDGIDTPGMYVPSLAYWFLRNSNTTGTGDIFMVFGGIPGALPIVGDWNGDGVDTTGLYIPSTGQWLLRNTNINGAGTYDISFVYGGIPGALPVAGDWNGDGIDTIGLYVPSTALWLLRNSNSTGDPDITLIYGGIAGGLPLVGDWNDDRIDTVGMYVPDLAYWFLRNTNTTGEGQIFLVYGGIAGAKPIVGHWSNSIVGGGTAPEPILQSEAMLVDAPPVTDTDTATSTPTDTLTASPTATETLTPTTSPTATETVTAVPTLTDTTVPTEAPTEASATHTPAPETTDG